MEFIDEIRPITEQAPTLYKKVMSESERINLFVSIKNGFAKATLQMLERKAKLGENVVISDADGRPLIIPAEEALKLFNMNS